MWDCIGWFADLLALRISFLGQLAESPGQGGEIDPRFRFCIIRLLFHNPFWFRACAPIRDALAGHARFFCRNTALSSWRRIRPGVGVMTTIPFFNPVTRGDSEPHL